MTTSFVHDVIVAGAGPVGLMLAIELRLGGASVLVLEQAEHSASALKEFPFGTRGLSIPTVEALHRRGLLVPLKARQHAANAAAGSKAALSAKPASQAGRPAGHFAGMPFFHDSIDTSRWPYFMAGPASATMAATMADLDAVLTAHATNLGVEIRRGLGVTRVDSLDDRVVVHAGARHFVAGWLVGCDGGRSTVRKTGGFAFSGTQPEFTGYSIEVDLAAPGELESGRVYTANGVYTFQPPGTIAMVDFDAGAYHRTRSVTRDHAQSVLQRVSGTGVEITRLKLATTWTDRAFQVDRYRNGRVLLAGDAAHVHSPLGGQGLNLGLGDAINLGWKLAATVRGHAPDPLLDSYFEERHAVGADVLDWSRAQVALMRPSASSRALADIIRELLRTIDGATYFADRAWSASLRLDLGESHPLVGRSAPDFELSDGRRLADHLRAGTGVLLEFGSDHLGAEVDRWSTRIVHAKRRTPGDFGLTAVLVRPDGVVAWASETSPDPQAFMAAAGRWFGEPDAMVI